MRLSRAVGALLCLALFSYARATQVAQTGVLRGTGSEDLPGVAARLADLLLQTTTSLSSQSKAGLKLRSHTGFGTDVPERVLTDGTVLYYGWDLNKMNIPELKDALQNVSRLVEASSQLEGSAAQVGASLHEIDQKQEQMAHLDNEMRAIHTRRGEALKDLYQSMNKITEFAHKIQTDVDRAMADPTKKDEALKEIAFVFDQWEGLTETLKHNRTNIDAIAAEFDSKQEAYIEAKKELNKLAKTNRLQVLEERSYRHNAWITTWQLDRQLAEFALHSGIVTQEEYDGYVTNQDSAEPKLMEQADVPTFRRDPKTYPRSFCSNAKTFKGGEVTTLKVEEMIAWQPEDAIVCYSVRELSEHWAASPELWGQTPEDAKEEFSDDFLSFFVSIESQLGLTPSRPKGQSCPRVTEEDRMVAAEHLAETANPSDSADAVLPPAELKKEFEEAAAHPDDPHHLVSDEAPQTAAGVAVEKGHNDDSEHAKADANEAAKAKEEAKEEEEADYNSTANPVAALATGRMPDNYDAVTGDTNVQSEKETIHKDGDGVGQKRMEEHSGDVAPDGGATKVEEPKSEDHKTEDDKPEEHKSEEDTHQEEPAGNDAKLDAATEPATHSDEEPKADNPTGDKGAGKSDGDPPKDGTEDKAKGNEDNHVEDVAKKEEENPLARHAEAASGDEAGDKGGKDTGDDKAGQEQSLKNLENDSTVVAKSAAGESSGETETIAKRAPAHHHVDI